MPNAPKVQRYSLYYGNIEPSDEDGTYVLARDYDDCASERDVPP